MKRVLIVDSDEDRRFYLQQELEKRYEIHICTRGDQAAELIEDLQPDALIINLALPYRNGLEVLRQLKHRPQAILALTNLVRSKTLEDAVALGVRDMLLYPCSIQTIAAHLDDLLYTRT